MTTLPTRLENNSSNTAIHSPEKIAAHRPAAPAATFNAVRPTDPPTGWPRNSPARRLPTPWARKSRLGSLRVLSGLGADSLTPAPWTRTRAATENAPASRLREKSARCGRAGAGRPLGISPLSRISGTETDVRMATITLGTTSAIRVEYAAILDRRRTTRTASANSPDSVAARLIRPGWVTRSQAWASANGPE